MPAVFIIAAIIAFVLILVAFAVVAIGIIGWLLGLAIGILALFFSIHFFYDGKTGIGMLSLGIGGVALFGCYQVYDYFFCGADSTAGHCCAGTGRKVMLNKNPNLTSWDEFGCGDQYPSLRRKALENGYGQIDGKDFGNPFQQQHHRLGSDPKPTDADLSKQLSQALYSNDQKTIRNILDEHRNLANSPTTALPLVTAAMNAEIQADVVRLLLSYGADPNRKQDSLGTAFAHVFSITDSALGINLNPQVEKFLILEPITRDKSDFSEMLREFLHHQKFGKYDRATEKFFDYVFSHHLFNIDDPLDDSEVTLVMESAGDSLPRVTKYLIGKGAALSKLDKSGYNALWRGLVSVPSIYVHDSVDDRTTWRCREYLATARILLKAYHDSMDEPQAESICAAMVSRTDLISGCYSEAYKVIEEIIKIHIRSPMVDLAQQVRNTHAELDPEKLEKLAQLLEQAAATPDM